MIKRILENSTFNQLIYIMNGNSKELEILQARTKELNEINACIVQHIINQLNKLDQMIGDRMQEIEKAEKGEK